MASTFIAYVEPHAAIREKSTGPRIRDPVAQILPSEYELDQLQWGQKLTGPTLDASSEASVCSATLTPEEPEQHLPANTQLNHAVDAIIQSYDNPPRNRWRLLGSACMFFLIGLSDAATGAVIPYVEEYYSIGYATVSLIFVAQAAGFVLAAPFCHAIDKRFGRARAMLFTAILMALAYALVVAALPFPVVVICYLMLGFGMGLFLAMTNLFVVNLLNGTIILGFAHALYGLGGVLSPIMATTMVSHGVRWSYFYAITSGFSVLSALIMGWAYRGFEADASAGQAPAPDQPTSSLVDAERGPSSMHLLSRALKNRATFLGAMFLLFYQGAEASISGWVISFLINYRGGDPASVGNVTAGFWAGITLGRLVLTPICARYGEKSALFILVATSAGLQLVVWLVPNIIGVAVAESFVGLALGPVYPCATSVVFRPLPKSIQVSALSFATAMGSSGGALIPLVTGLMAQSLSTVVLHPIVLFSCAMMEVALLLLPKDSKRSE